MGFPFKAGYNALMFKEQIDPYEQCNDDAMVWHVCWSRVLLKTCALGFF